MSQWWDVAAGDNSGSVGPQTDGTNILADAAATIPTPADTAGGAPAQYGQGILDIFKYGVGQYSTVVQQQNALDYKRYEATSGGLYQQGKAATMAKAATGGNSGLLVIGAATVVLLVVLMHKG